MFGTITPQITFEHAWDAVRQIKEYALNDGLAPVCLCVVAEDGQMVLFARMDGAPERLIAIVQAKAYSAVRMRCSTQDFRNRLLSEQLSLADFCDSALTSLPGGIPIMYENACLGAVAVSGRALARDVELAERFARILTNLCLRSLGGGTP